MKELTKAEEQVMQALWQTKKSFVKDIVEGFPEPKPAYNTISTIVRILERKGFVGHEAFGNTHQYFPKISKKDYSRNFLSRFVKNYFGNSATQLVSFFTDESNLSIEELESLKSIIEEKIKNKEEDI
ncbi:MAG: BlaI family transcriptional regulator, penicillinase repressor [Bacteroidota bacterium]|nr:BlaI family transcriptional regulator, penicillinase repressor [Bacteroidota bacterium]